LLGSRRDIDCPPSGRMPRCPAAPSRPSTPAVLLTLSTANLTLSRRFLDIPVATVRPSPAPLLNILPSNMSTPALSPAASHSSGCIAHRHQPLPVQADVAWSILWPSPPPPKTKVPPGRMPLLRTELSPLPRRRPRGLSDLPAELWQSILLLLPASSLWHARGVHPHWKGFVEAHLCRTLLQETRLILQVDTRPSFDFLGTFPSGRLRGDWLEYDVPSSGRRFVLRPEKPKLAKSGRHLLLGGKLYAVQVSIGGYLGPVPTARRVEYEEKGRLVRVDWRVLLGEMFGHGGGWARDMRLGELMHRPERSGSDDDGTGRERAAPSVDL